MRLLCPAAGRLPPLVLAACLLLALAGCGGVPVGPWLAGESAGAAPGSDGARSANLTRMGETALRTGETATAAALFEEALMLDRGSLPAALGLGNALLVEGRPQDAARAFEQALTIEGDSADARYGYARAMLALRRPEVAAEHLERVARQQPNNTQALNALGVAYDLQGRNDLAIAAYRRGLATDPASLALRNNLGLSLALAGRPDAAVAQLRPLGEGPEATRRTRQNLALAYGLQGDLDAARRLGRVDLSERELQENLAYIATVRGLDDPALRAATLAPNAAARRLPERLSAVEPAAAPLTSAPVLTTPRAGASTGGGWFADLGRDASPAAAELRWRTLERRHPKTFGRLTRPTNAGHGDGPTLAGPVASKEAAAKICAVLWKDVPTCVPVRP